MGDGLKEIQYPLSWFSIEEWISKFTVDATNVESIESNHNVVCGMKLPIGYNLSPTELTNKLTETCLVSMMHDLNKCMNVTFDVITRKFYRRLLEVVSVLFHGEFSRITGLLTKV